MVAMARIIRTYDGTPYAINIPYSRALVNRLYRLFGKQRAQEGIGELPPIQARGDRKSAAEGIGRSCPVLSKGALLCAVDHHRHIQGLGYPDCRDLVAKRHRAEDDPLDAPLSKKGQ